MNRLTLGAVLCASLLTSLSFSQAIISNGSSVNTIVPMGNATVTTVAGQYIQVNLNQQGAWAHLTLPTAADWSGATHMVVTLKAVSSSPAFLFMALDSGPDGWMWSDTYIPSGQTVTIAMPLNKSTDYGLPYWPSLPDSSMSQALAVGNIYKNNIRRFSIWNNDPQGAVAYQVISVAPAALQQNTTQFIDLYGQQTINFPGKVTSDSQLQSQAAQDLLLSGQFPYSADAYGGVAGSGTGGTGRWTTAKQNGKWYILDPSGNRFFSAGVVGAGWSAEALFQDRQWMYQAGALPDPNGPFGGQYYTYANPATGQPGQGYNFYGSNLQRKFGNNWELQASNNIVRRMRTWGLNTVGPLNTLAVNPNMAYTPCITIGGAFARITTLNGQSMPDVWDPAWQTTVQSVLGTEIAKLAGDDMNMGVFIDNELPWSKHMIQDRARYLLPFSVLSAPGSQPAKTRFIRDLQVLYRTVSRLNASWGTNYLSWTDMQNSTVPFNPATINANMNRDMNQFTSKFATKYFSTIKSTLTSLNYQGLYLGCRFLYYTSDVLNAAKQYANVISFNAYEVVPSRYRDDLKALDFPVLVSEVGFGASDLGRIIGYNPNIATEAGRVACYRGYMNEAMTWPNLVGIHWYKWEDETPAGRMYDNEVHALGLVSITDMPYSQLTAAVQEMLTAIHTRLLTP